MKKLSKALRVMLAMAMTLAMAVPAFAYEPAETTTITIGNPGISTFALTDTTLKATTFEGYQLMTLDTILACADTTHTHEKTCYKFAYELNDKYDEILYAAANEIKPDDDVADRDALLDYLETLDADATRTFADKVYLKIKANDNLTPDKENLTTSFAVEQGYWLFADTTVYDTDTDDDGVVDATAAKSLVLLDTKGELAINVKPKQDAPEIDKVIDGAHDTDDSTTGDVDYNNAAIGDKVPFKVHSKVPDMTGYDKYYFVVNDTLSKGLTFNNDVEITVGNKTLVAGTDFTVETVGQDGQSFSIIFKNFIQYNTAEYIGKDIIITYSATLDEDAVIGTTGNPNTVDLTYSNNPYVTDEGDPSNPDKPGTNSPVGETPESTTRTFVTAIQLHKEDEQGKALTGAKFQIAGTKQNIVIVNNTIFRKSATGTYYQLKNGTYTETAPTATGDENDNTHLYDSVDTKYELVKDVSTETTTENIVAEGYVNAEGNLIFKGLSAGTYTITELIAPDGYNILKAPIEITVKYTAPTGTASTCTWSFEGNGFKEATVSDSGIISLTVVNKTGVELPETGGMGTTLFYLAGGIMVTAAAVLLITKKRMSNEQ